MSLNKYGLILLISISFGSFGQLTISNLHYRSKIDKSISYFKDTLTNHSSILPRVESWDHQQYSNKSAQLIKLKNDTYMGDYIFKYAMRIYPIGDLSLGGEYIKNNTDNPKYIGGLGLGIDFTSKKFFFTGKLMPYGTYSTFVRDSIQEIISTDLGTTRAITENIFQRSELLLAYRPNKSFTFIGGYGKNYFGEGYRSLLLSDNASNYPFLKIETSLKSIKYVNLYSIWNDNSVNPANKSLDKMKFSATHYLSWNIIRELNLSIFETVVWQKQDTSLNRGFDISYLNPVVFYRPVEYSNGSSDNVLLGANLTYKINKNHTIYSQIILDEFLLSELKSKNKWWGNKYGIQFGYKSNSFLIDNLFIQAEFNMVRPFTYSHKYSVQSYGHLNASVTHPLGANFYEVLNILSYKKGEHRFTHKLTYSSYGVDSSNVNYGQNIFNSYSLRDGDYGHEIMQGTKTTVINETLIFETPMFKQIDLYINFTYNYRMHYTEFQTTHAHFLMIGIRSRLWNTYNDI